MPSATYLRTFSDYLKTRTDAPADFHLHAGLASLAVALGTHCYVDGPAREVFANIMSVCLAPSGMGKSVPLDMSANVVRAAGFVDCLLPSSFSTEAILDSLSREHVGFWVIQEFAAFQALLSRDYNAGAEQTFTDLSDVPETYTRKLIGKTSRSFTLQYPCVTILGASSPDWFAQAFRGNSLRGGWLARFLFCPSKAAGAAIGDPGPRDRGVEAQLADHLRRVANLHGRFELGPARPLYAEFAQKCRLAARDSVDFGGMRSRGPTMALKLAMLMHVSRDPATLGIALEDMRNAIAFVERTHTLAERYLSEEVAHNQDDAARIRILDIVRASGGACTRSVALKNSHMDKRKFDMALETLVESERLAVVPNGRTRILKLPDFAVSREMDAKLRNGQVGELAKSAKSGET